MAFTFTIFVEFFKKIVKCSLINQKLLPDVCLEADGVEVDSFRSHELCSAADHLQLRVWIKDLSGKPEVDDFHLEDPVKV